MDTQGTTVVATRAVSMLKTPDFIQPKSFDDVKHMANLIVRARWAPKSYNDRNGAPSVEAVEIGIITGLSLGIMNPIAAINAIAVINGRPTIWGDGMMGVIQASGVMEKIEVDRKGSGDTFEVTVKVWRKDYETPFEGFFSHAMAKTAGLSGKEGPWRAYPQRMCEMRARSWALRAGFSDVLLGLPVAEEMIDGGDLVEVNGVYIPKGDGKPEPQLSDYRPDAPAAEAATGQAPAPVPTPTPTPSPTPAPAPAKVADAPRNPVEDEKATRQEQVAAAGQTTEDEPEDLGLDVADCQGEIIGSHPTLTAWQEAFEAELAKVPVTLDTLKAFGTANGDTIKFIESDIEGGKEAVQAVRLILNEKIKAAKAVAKADTSGSACRVPIVMKEGGEANWTATYKAVQDVVKEITSKGMAETFEAANADTLKGLKENARSWYNAVEKALNKAKASK